MLCKQAHSDILPRFRVTSCLAELVTSCLGEAHCLMGNLPLSASNPLFLQP